MKISVSGLGAATAVVFGLIALSTGMANLLWPAYGVALLNVLDSLYPGYTFGRWGFGGVLVVTLYAALDGLIIGVVFAWVYNIFTPNKKK